MQLGNKNNSKKTNRPRKRVTSKLVAEVVGCGDSTVRQVLSDTRNKDTDLGQRIEVADMLLDEGINKLIEEVKRVVRH